MANTGHGGSLKKYKDKNVSLKDYFSFNRENVEYSERAWTRKQKTTAICNSTN